MALRVARATAARARASTRWRFSRFLPCGLRLRSMISNDVRSGRLLHPHIPFDEPADLSLSIAAGDHTAHEIIMFPLGLIVFLGAEADHREQILHLAEHALFDNFPNLLVAGPGRVAPAIGSPRPQRELHDLVAEILRVGDAGRFLDLR